MKLLAEAQFMGLVNIDPDTIIFTLINTLIIFLLYRFLLHNKVMAVLQARADKVNAEIKAAEDAQKAAEAAEAEYAAKIEKSKEEAQVIIAEATKRASLREQEIITEATSEAAKIKKNAEESIKQEKKRAVNEIKDEISEIVVMAASKVAEKEISEKENEQIINSFLVNVGK